jgi:preprotein translocase subunit SecA
MTFNCVGKKRSLIHDLFKHLALALVLAECLGLFSLSFAAHRNPGENGHLRLGASPLSVSSDEGYSSSGPDCDPGQQGRSPSPPQLALIPGVCPISKGPGEGLGPGNLRDLVSDVRLLSPSPSPCPQIKPRTRAELLEILRGNGSLSEAEVAELSWQLEAIDDVIKNKRRTGNPPLRSPDQERLVTELGKVALEVKKVRDLFPRDTQIIAVLQFLKGKNTLLQAGTGQGKSLIVGMTAIMQSKLGLPPGDGRPMSVQILAPTANLAKAGLDENLKLFEACGVRARLVHSKIKGEARSSDIMYGTPFDFEAQALLEATYPDLPRMLLDGKVRRTVLMDESDSHLIDGASGRVLQSDPDPLAPKMTSLMTQIAQKVAQFYQSPARSSAQKQQMIQELEAWVSANHPELKERWKEQGQMWVGHALEVYNPSPQNPWRDGIKFVTRSPLVDELSRVSSAVKDLNISPAEKRNIHTSLLDLAVTLEKLKALDPKSSPSSPLYRPLLSPLISFLEKIEPYKDQFSPELRSQFNRLVELSSDIHSNGKKNEQIESMLYRGQIQYLSEGTGQIMSNMKFSHGVQEFLEMKHLGRVITEPTISVRSYSMNRFLRESDLILGLSGTVGTGDETLAFQKKIWNMNRNPVLLPEFAVPQLKKAEEAKHLKTQEQWVDSILDSTRKYARKQPVLIVAENPEKARILAEQFSSQPGLKTSLYMEMTDEHLLSRELAPGEVVITTNLGGRGSDYKYDKKKAPDGLHVIVGFDSDEERIIRQAIGRAGRAGAPGSWQQISFGEQLKQKPDIARVQASVIQTISEDMAFETYRALTRIIPPQSKEKKEMTQLVMSWMSDPSVSREIKSNMASEYTDYEAASQILSKILMREWKKNLAAVARPTNAHREFLRILNAQNQYGRVDDRLEALLSKSLYTQFKELERIRAKK